MTHTAPAPLDRRQARNAAIRADFRRMERQHLKSDHIVSTLCQTYYLAPSTVWAIVNATGRYGTNPARA